jgi:hypothetical protein
LFAAWNGSAPLENYRSPQLREIKETLNMAEKKE